jgi:uncharacterized cupin superfamily protein
MVSAARNSMTFASKLKQFQPDLILTVNTVTLTICNDCYEFAMKPFKDILPATGMQELPPLAETPGYEVLEGAPVASIRFDRGSPHSQHRLGIWKCTPGTFRCTEKGDELQTVLEGQLTLILEDGSEHHLRPGQSVYTEKGEKVTWKIIETVTKVFFTNDPNAQV